MCHALRHRLPGPPAPLDKQCLAAIADFLFSPPTSKLSAAQNPLPRHLYPLPILGNHHHFLSFPPDGRHHHCIPKLHPSYHPRSWEHQDDPRSSAHPFGSLMRTRSCPDVFFHDDRSTPMIFSIEGAANDSPSLAKVVDKFPCEPLLLSRPFVCLLAC